MQGTVNSPCKDTQCKDKLDVRTVPLVTNHCILTAVVLLNKDKFLGNQSSRYKESLLYWVTGYCGAK